MVMAAQSLNKQTDLFS